MMRRFDKLNLLVLVIWTTMASSAVAMQLNFGSVEPPPGVCEKPEEKDGAQFCWLSTRENLPVFSDPACSRPLGTVGYLEEFNSLWRKDDVVLLVRADGDPATATPRVVVGYAKQADLLVSSNNVYQCLRSDKRIARKALVVHRWAKGSAVTEKAGLRWYPDVSAPEKEEVNLYSILYVHSFSNPNPGKQDDPNGFCFVANRPNVEVRQTSNHKTAFLGWLPNNRVFFWDHRQAIEYDKSPDTARWRRENDKPVQFFASAADMKAGKTAMQEDLSKGPWPHYLQRYPIISSTPENIGGVDCYRVGVVGDSYSAVGEHMATAGLEAQIRQKLEELNIALGDLDVLFVIDATGSMFEYYKSIRESVGRIREGLEKGRERPIRYAVLYYRDYTEAGDRDSWIHFFADFANSAEFASKFPHTDSRGGSDNPPSLYGIHTGLEMASFSPKSMRAVILIGDMGNEQPDERGFTVQKVIDALQAKRCSFYAIQTATGAKGPKHWLFDTQADAISSALKMPEARLFNADGSDVSQAIVASVSKSNQLAVLLRKALQSLKDGKASFEDAIKMALAEAGISTRVDPVQGVPLSFGDYGTWMQQELIQRLGDEGIDTKVFVEKRIQHFGIALAPVQLPGAPSPSFVTKTLLLRSEFQQLTSVLGVVVRRGLNPSNCTEVWRQAVNQLSGDIDQEVTFDENRPLSDYMMMALGIPVKSELLRKSVLEIKRMDPDKVATLRTDLERLYTEQNNYNASLTTDGKTSEKHWFLLHGLEYGWIPLEQMP